MSFEFLLRDAACYVSTKQVELQLFIYRHMFLVLMNIIVCQTLIC